MPARQGPAPFAPIRTVVLPNCSRAFYRIWGDPEGGTEVEVWDVPQHPAFELARFDSTGMGCYWCLSGRIGEGIRPSVGATTGSHSLTPARRIREISTVAPFCMFSSSKHQIHLELSSSAP
jgi:hypothetical protein